MKRRDVIKLGAVAAGAAVAVPGCVPRPVNAMSGPSGGAEWNAMLDEQLRPLQGPGLLHRLVKASRDVSEESRAKLVEKDAMFRRLLSTVLITQSFRELPKETQAAPDVQARMWSHLDQINGTVFELGDMLASLDADARANVRKKLRDKPDLPDALAQALDARAASAGLSRRRRLQLRRMLSETAFRLKNADPSSIIDEYVAKVDRLRETTTRDAAAIEIAEKLGERSFWKAQRLQADDPAAGSGAPATTAPAAPGTTAPPAPAPSGPPGMTPMTTPPSMAEVLTKSARSAARRGDCHTIEVLRPKVQELDPVYYNQHFAADPVINGCRPGVSTLPPPEPEGPLRPSSERGTVDPSVKGPHPGSTGLRVGGYMLGIGLVVGGAGLAIADAGAFVGVFAVTAGVILVGIGLIVLLISALIYAAN
jgi:hypothetical protein